MAQTSRRGEYAYYVYGETGEKEKLIGKFMSYFEAVGCKEASRRSEKYDKVFLEEPMTKAKAQALKDLAEAE